MKMTEFNKKAFEHAMSLIKEGKVNTASRWSFAPADGNRILGDPPDWGMFSLWHLGTEPGVSRQSKGFYKFPYGKDGKVFRSALVAIKQRAGQTGDGEIIEEAGKLLDAVDTNELAASQVCMAMKIKGGENPPEWVQMLPLGRHETLKGDFEMNREEMLNVIEHFKIDFKDVDFLIDYEHKSLTGEEAPAAAWVTQLEARDDGVWGKVEWTPRAAESLRNREYRYLSPVFLLEAESRKVTRLISAALTNTPAIRSLEAIIATSTNSPGTGAQLKEDSMLEKLLVALGLAPGAGEDAAIVAVQTLKDEVKAAQDLVIVHEPLVNSMADIAKHVGLEEGYTASAVTASVMVLSQKVILVDEITAERDKFKARVLELEGGEIEALVASAIKEGKITPAQEAWALGVAKENRKTFEEFIAKAPTVKPADGELNKTDAAAGGGKVKETTESLAIMSMCDVSQEMMDKFGPDAKTAV